MMSDQEIEEIIGYLSENCITIKREESDNEAKFKYDLAAFIYEKKFEIVIPQFITKDTIYCFDVCSFDFMPNDINIDSLYYMNRNHKFSIYDIESFNMYKRKIKLDNYLC